jgi:ABC-type glycerol-3-phosphate transport system substrate-binding protein
MVASPTGREAQVARGRRLLVGVLAACCLLAGCGGDDDTQAAATTVATTSTSVGPSSSSRATTTTAAFSGVLVQATVTGSNVQTASRRVRVDIGQKVRIQVQADRAEEVHVHGYDLKADVAPGRPAVLDFTADVPGVFEVELEQSELKLFELQVQ